MLKGNYFFFVVVTIYIICIEITIVIICKRRVALFSYADLVRLSSKQPVQNYHE